MIKKLKIITLIIVLVLLFILGLILHIGCNPDYDIRVYNLSGAPIQDVSLEWGNLWPPIGDLNNDLSKTIVCANKKEPYYFKKTTISWVDEHGNKHAKKVLVPPKPMSKHVILIFEIRKDEQVSVYLDEDFHTGKTYDSYYDSYYNDDDD